MAINQIGLKQKIRRGPVSK